MKNKLAKPIFFVGAPRSGTTVSFEAFARHQSLGWPHDYTNRFPRLPIFGLVLRLTDNALISLYGHKDQYGSTGVLQRILPAPAEAYPFWDHYSGVDFRNSYLLQTRASEAAIRDVRSAALSILRYSGRERFAAKLTGPTRMQYLRSIFPDCQFVHIIRDGRAVTDSLLRVDFWNNGGGRDTPWWKGGLAELDLKLWEGLDHDPAVLAALQWKCIIETARSEKEELGLGPTEYLELKYEDFVDEPHKRLSELYDWAGLQDAARAHEYVDSQNLRNMNYKHAEHLTETELRGIDQVLGTTLQRFGYE